MATKVVTEEQALEIAREIAGDNATVGIHHGDGKNWGIRITGTWPEGANRIARGIQERIGGRHHTAQNWCCVWLVNRRGAPELDEYGLMFELRR